MPAAAVAATPEPSSTVAVPQAVAAAPAAGEVTVSGATHVVRPGESLWAIAAAMVGADASPAKIARQVHRLWELNAERIDTVNPDLLIVGTRLVLR